MVKADGFISDFGGWQAEGCCAADENGCTLFHQIGPIENSRIITTVKMMPHP